jgi:hypothetical protein
MKNRQGSMPRWGQFISKPKRGARRIRLIVSTFFFLFLQTSAHTIFETDCIPCDLKAFMVGADRGGAAGKVDNFCCCCDRHKDTRANIIFSKDNIQEEFSHKDWAALQTKWTQTPNLAFFSPIHNEITDHVGVRRKTNKNQQKPTKTNKNQQKQTKTNKNNNNDDEFFNE